MNTLLFPDDSPLAVRQPKTDRLIIERILKHAAQVFAGDLSRDKLNTAHAIVLRWADLDSSSQLAQMNENQLQGEFLGDIFGQVLGYTRFSDGLGSWNLEQHHTIAGQQPDAIIGKFKANQPRQPVAVVELKGPLVHLDRDRSNGRTAVQQAWEYLNHTTPDCRWAIVSNLVSFRLYERNSTPRRYEHFTLQSLRNFDTFCRFYALLAVDQLLLSAPRQPTRLEQLLTESTNRQREVGSDLYNTYSTYRTRLVAHLHLKLKHPLDDAIEMAQRLLDRVIFIAFCEDRKLLDPDTIKRAYQVNGFSAATNPRWQSFKTLFKFIDKGSSVHDIPAYNGGLFAKHPVDDLELDDRPWTEFFHTLGRYDFADEVNLDVLGHLFEQSITEIEKLRETGLFGGDADKAEQFAQMPQSAKRKQMGIYYTPPQLTSRIVEYTVDELIHQRLSDLAEQHGVPQKQAALGEAPNTRDYWQQALQILRDLKIVDPACGSGAFLFQAYEILEHRYVEIIGNLKRLHDPQADSLADQIPQFILHDNLYGVDLSREAVEITQLALWIRSATPGQTLATLSKNIVHGNSLVHDPAAHPAGFDWKSRFPEVFSAQRAGPSPAPASSDHDKSPSATSDERRGDTPRLADGFRGGFDCVIGNPPWERIKLQEREFFALSAPLIATATNAAKRRQLVAKLEKQNPELYKRYQEALKRSDDLLTYCRKSKQYPLTGKGDINTYAVFAELAYQLVAPHGRVGILTPSGIASDNTTKDFFAAVAESNRLIRLFDFENRTKQFFPDVDGRFKFCILNFAGEAVKIKQTRFVFFAHSVEELDDPKRRIELSGDDIKLLNPNTRTCPIFRTKRDAEITKTVYRRVRVLIDHSRKGPTANPWGVKFHTMFHQTNDAELFVEADALKAQKFTLNGNRWVKAGKKPRVFLPLYEAKMVQAYDHRAADIVTTENNWVRQGQTDQTTLSAHQNPEHIGMPRFWVADTAVDEAAGQSHSHFLAFKDVTSPTNQRTMIAAFLPYVGVVNSAPLVFTDTTSCRECCLLANLNSYAYDFVMRQKISNVHLNFFIVEQIPTLTPDVYEAECPWDRKVKLEKWISERVLKLTCTAEDMLPLTEACKFKAGSFKKEYGGRLHKWDPADRIQLMAELDAAYFILYGINRDDAQYILSTFNGIHAPCPLLAGQPTIAQHTLAVMDQLAK